MLLQPQPALAGHTTRGRALRSMCRRSTALLALALLCTHARAEPQLPALGTPSVSPLEVANMRAALTPDLRGFGQPCANATWTSGDTALRLRKKLAPDLVFATKVLQNDPKYTFPKWDEALWDSNVNAHTLMMTGRLTYLSEMVIAYCAADGQARPADKAAYLAKALEFIDSIVQQPTWQYASHPLRRMPKAPLKERLAHREVELCAAMHAEEVSQALYMLGDAVPDGLRRRALAALKDRVVDPFDRTIQAFDGRHDFMYSGSNWNPVMLQGVLMAVLATPAANDDQRARLAAAGFKLVKLHLGFFPADGYAPEGPGYFGFGLSAFVRVRELLLQATRGGFDIFAEGASAANTPVKAQRILGFYDRFMMNRYGVMAPFSDGGNPNGRPRAGLQAYYQETFSTDPLRMRLAWTPRSLGAGELSALAFTMRNMATTPPEPPVLPRVPLAQSDWFETSGVFVSRGAADDDMAVTLRAGGGTQGMGFNHVHLDAGSYAIAIGAEVVTGEVGTTEYTTRTFSRDRYKIRAIGSYGHPVPRLLVPGIPGGTAPLPDVAVEQVEAAPPQADWPLQSPGHDRLSITLTGAYAPSDALRRPPYNIRPQLYRHLDHYRQGANSAIAVADAFRAARPARFETAVVTLGRSITGLDAAGDVLAPEANNRMRDLRFDADGKGASFFIDSTKPNAATGLPAFSLKARVTSSMRLEATGFERVMEEGRDFYRLALRTTVPTTQAIITVTYTRP